VLGIEGQDLKKCEHQFSLSATLLAQIGQGQPNSLVSGTCIDYQVS